MILFRYFLSVLILLLIANCVQAEIKATQAFHCCDTTALNKQKVSKQLVQLRDSINNWILTIQQKVDNQKSGQQLAKSLHNLQLQKSEIEKALEDLLSTNDLAWDDTMENRAIIEIDEWRRTYYQTLNDIKDIVNIKNYH